MAQKIFYLANIYLPSTAYSQIPMVSAAREENPAILKSLAVVAVFTHLASFRCEFKVKGTPESLPSN